MDRRKPGLNIPGFRWMLLAGAVFWGLLYLVLRSCMS